MLGEFKENDCFGEIAVFLHIPRTASIVCNQPLTLLLELRRVRAASHTLTLYMPFVRCGNVHPMGMGWNGIGRRLMSRLRMNLLDGQTEFVHFLKLLPNVNTIETLMRQRTAEQFRKLQGRVPFYGAIPQHLFEELAKICKIEEVRIR